MWLYILWCKHFEESFGKTHTGEKLKRCNRVVGLVSPPSPITLRTNSPRPAMPSWRINNCCTDLRTDLSNSLNIKTSKVWVLWPFWPFSNKWILVHLRLRKTWFCVKREKGHKSRAKWIARSKRRNVWVQSWGDGSQVGNLFRANWPRLQLLLLRETPPHVCSLAKMGILTRKRHSYWGKA